MKKITAPIIPQPGARLGVVCGPGEFPEDHAGIVLCQIENRWGTFAVVLLDTGRIDTCHGLNNGPGIGWHSLPLRGVTAKTEQKF